MNQTPFKAQKVVLIVLIGLLAAVAIGKAMKPDAGLLKFRVDGNVAYGYGTTTGRSLGDFKKFLRENSQVRTLVLKKMPGTQDGLTNTKIARLIRKSGLDTHLDSDSFIASGAVDLFIAGNERTMECGALIGVHSWSIHTEKKWVRGKSFYPGNMGTDRYQKFHEDYLSDMGVDPAFYVFTREAAGPDDLHFLTADEIKRFKLLTQDGGCR